MGIRTIVFHKGRVAVQGDEVPTIELCDLKLTNEQVQEIFNKHNISIEDDIMDTTWDVKLSKDKDSVELRKTFVGPTIPHQTIDYANVLIVVREDSIKISQNGKWHCTINDLEELLYTIKIVRTLIENE